MPEQRLQRELIAETLREEIIRGTLSPDTRLQEIELSERFQTSRTPVREALRQLESEGFIAIRPRRGAVVTPITSKDIEEFYELKSVLEGYAARRATERLRDADISRMERLNNELDELRKSGDYLEMVEVHNRFHEVFVQNCGNERIASLIKGLVQQYQRLRISLSHTDAIQESIATHREIIQAFRERDANKAESLVRRNSLEGSQALVQRIRVSESEGSSNSRLASSA